MSYLNRLLIDEETQHECSGVFEDYYLSLSPSMKQNLKKQLKRIPYVNLESTLVHVISAARPWNIAWDNVSLNHISQLRNLFESHFNLVITRLWSERIECVSFNKEEFEMFHKKGAEIRVDYDTLQAKTSVGNDIERFNKQMMILKQDQFPLIELDPTITFHLSLISHKEKIKTETQNSKQTWSEDKNNYELSVCFRKTCGFRILVHRK